jgi:siroheme synthase-like protein
VTAPAASTLAVELLVRDRLALVVGCGAEAESKIARLLDAGARVRVVSEGAAISEHVHALATRGSIELVDRALLPADLEDACVVFVATELEALGAELAEAARGSGRLVSTLDRPEASTFVNPAVVRANGVAIAISTGGTIPSLAKRLRVEFERLLSDAELGRFVAEVRDRRGSKPRGERSAEGKRLLEGFGIDWKIEYPDWFRR